MDVASIPTAESEVFEFKCSKTDFPDALKKKLQCGVCAMANSGGGTFIAGVSNDGDPDGGFPSFVGRKPINEWIEQAIHEIQPPPPGCRINILDDPMGRGTINSGNVVAAIEIPQSHIAPHQAPDKKYYIRAGAHTEPASHFLIESIRALRHLARPRLVHVAEVYPFSSMNHYLQIEITPLTEAPALNVFVDLDPTPGKTPVLPMLAPVIDRAHRFEFRFEIPSQNAPEFKLSVTYEDVSGKEWAYAAEVVPSECLEPQHRVNSHLRDIARSLQNISGKLR